MKFDKLGLVSVSFRGNTPEEILKSMKKAGLRYIEWGSDVHAPKGDTAALNELVALQNNYNIKCCSYGTYFNLETKPLDELSEYISAAKLLGTNILRIWCGAKNSEEYSDSERANLFNICKSAADIAEKSGVILCMECHINTYTNKGQAAAELMRYVNSDAFRMYWQPNQFLSHSENLAYARLISKYTVNIHVFNSGKDHSYPLKDGFDEWCEFLSEFNSDQALLLEFMPDNRIESLETEAAALIKIAEAAK